ncbi:DUF4397 domain-containing protein [Nannocystis sp. ILAH1]|uniref:DUF4397 domain-containing protein n=1 Tax=Nannocystis sp. ILAH1 TaxID=2996789 RepID=UPI00226E793D|nr:DUF4397 domain-containing protein [Nannocystis sp. ILAH1]MCY0989217.1 DUF4397 domain-containing protein [Nannocystis sp. ILAH1]
MEPIRALSVFTVTLALLGCGNDDRDPASETGAAVRVVHLSPDAPSIDAFVDGQAALVTNLTFTQGSMAANVEVGQHSIEVAATGTGAGAAVVQLADVLLEEGRRYTAFAFGKLAEVQLSVVEDSTQGLASGHVRIRVVHAGAGVGNVDVYAIGGDGSPDLIADNLRYGTFAEPVDLPTDPFVAGLDVDDDGKPDLLYSIPALPAGVVVNVFATVDDAGAAFLLAQLPDGTTRIDAAQQRLRVVHLSPDAPAVRPLFGGAAPAEFGEIAFPASTDYASISVPAGKIDITTDGTVATSVLSADLTFEEGASYTAAAIGRVADLTALVFKDDRDGLADDEIRVRAIHGAPDVGPVDVYQVAADGSATSILSDLDFGDAADPLDLPPGAYTLGVDVNDDAKPDLYFELPELPGGTLANVYVTQEDGGQPFVLAQLDGATTARIDLSESQVRVLHLSRDAPNVDVYAGEARVVTDLAFKEQSTFLTVPSGTLGLAVTAAGMPIDTAVIAADASLLPGRAYTVVAYDDLASIGALVLEDDAAGLAATDIRVPITHVAPGVTRGDIYVLLNGGMMFGTQLVDDFGFGETPEAIDVPAGMYTVGFDAEADGDVQAIFDLPLLTPGTYARAYVYQEADDSVAVLVQLANTVTAVPAN